ncbi:MAG: hypothetical protein LKF88_02445 [Microbacteriaceae bacterium]|jgi:hypothetical protein|nr:hypothetical protein [Microbacteriaceae bacterium]MCI1206660.1 hypothetical protein [Microbacteriaceae bacterium]
MEAPVPSHPVDIAVVRAVVDILPGSVRTRLEPVSLTLWSTRSGADRLLCLDAGAHTLLRLTEESARRLERELHSYVRRW